MVIDVPTLLTLNDKQLNDTFSSGVADPIPDGSAKGTAIVANGTKFSSEIADAVSRFVWQGKTFSLSWLCSQMALPQMTQPFGSVHKWKFPGKMASARLVSGALHKKV